MQRISKVMDRWMRCLCAALLGMSMASPLKADVIFQDGFETGELGSAWTVSGVDTGRVRVSSDFSPYAGSKHLVLDDSVDDSAYGVAEATLNVDLTKRRNVYLTFRAKSLGNVAHFTSPYPFTGTRAFDAVCLSVDGGTTWQRVTVVASVGTSWQNFRISLDTYPQILGGSYVANTLIRFSFYGTKSAPLDGLAFDDVKLEGDYDTRIFVGLPAKVKEGGGTYTGTVTLPAVSETPVEVGLVSSVSGQLNLPASVTVPAGQLSANFDFTVVDDGLVNLTRTITVSSGTVVGYQTASTSLLIEDNETPPIASLRFPSFIREGEAPSLNGSLSLSFPAAVPITFALTSSPTGEASMPSTVTIPAGQSLVYFTIGAVDDTIVDGNFYVTVTASASGLAPAQWLTTMVDDDNPKLALYLPTVRENMPGIGTVTIPYAVSHDVSITLYSASSSVEVPRTVVIPAGQLYKTFTITPYNDTLVNFTRRSSIEATSSGFVSIKAYQTVFDDEPTPVFSLSIPSLLNESDPIFGQPENNATLSMDIAADVYAVVDLSTNPQSQINTPVSLTIAPGQKKISFKVYAENDWDIDGDIPVTMTAKVGSDVMATARTVAVDNEIKKFSFQTDSTLYEGRTVMGRIMMNGFLSSDLVVSLSPSGDSSVSVPASVTIKAGSHFVEFPISAQNNAFKDGTRTFHLAVSADSFPSESYELAIKDDEIVEYKFPGLTDIVRTDSPLYLGISAKDVEGNSIFLRSQAVTLSVVLPDGSSLPTTPSQLVIGGDNWQNSINLPPNMPAGSRLRIVDSSGIKTESNPLEIIRFLPQIVNNMVYDAARGRIYATVSKWDSSGNAEKVIAIDPATLQITGSVFLGQQPQQITLTKGGEYIYVSMYGNGTIAKIDPETFAVVHTFAVGNDTNSRPLYASSICTVAGKPDTLIVSQAMKLASPSHYGVAVYDRGVMRPVRTHGNIGSNLIAASADDSIFFGYDNGSSEFRLHRLQMTSQGMVELTASKGLMAGYSAASVVSDGNRIYSIDGTVIDGSRMRKIGKLSDRGVPCPDASINSVYYLGAQRSDSWYWNYCDHISVHDRDDFSMIRKLTMPVTTGMRTFIRAGSGFAFNTDDSLAFVTGTQLVPSQPPADLAVSISSVPKVATGDVVSYSVTVSNLGPNAAKEVALSIKLSTGQALRTATSQEAAITVSGSSLQALIPTISHGESVVINVKTVPSSSGSVGCQAQVNAVSADADFSNNKAFKLVVVGFESKMDHFNRFGLKANNILNDPTRHLLWMSVAASEYDVLERAVISLNPETGLFSDPIPLLADPMPGAFAISDNGRYLYVGLRDVSEVARIDLSSSPPLVSRVSLGQTIWQTPNYAQDLQVLEGDGLSFIMVGSEDDCASVYEGEQRRGIQTNINTLDCLEKTSDANTFIGFNQSSTSYGITKLLVNSSGVTVTQTAFNLIDRYDVAIKGGGNVLLSGSAQLIDSDTLSLKHSLGEPGIPCFDQAYQRASLVDDHFLRSYDAGSGELVGTLELPSTTGTNWVADCVRWGRDGFAILGNEGNIYITRWSEAIPAERDENADGISDRWASTHFNSLNVNPAADSDGDGIADGMEYLFGSHPKAGSRNPLTVATAEDPVNSVIHLKFPRRKGISRSSYDYETSPSIGTWGAPVGVTETVLSIQTVDGVEIENVDATIRTEKASRGFVRMKWK